MTTPGDGGRPSVWTYDEAILFLNSANYKDALRVLDRQPDGDPTGKLQALQALSHFHLEEYNLAAASFQAALQRDPENVAWKKLLELSQANAMSAVNVHVPELRYFDPQSLLAQAELRTTLPAPPEPLPKHRLRTRLRLIAGESLGRVASLGVDAITWTLGKVPGYRGRVWTNWYKRPYMVGLLVLAHMRDQLNKHNLINTYSRGTLTGFQREGQTPPPGVTHFRTADGTWNNLLNPKEGASGTRFLRNVTSDAIRRAMAADLMSPSPREVSRALLTRTGPMKEVTFLNLLAASWINFQNHDWIHHGEPVADEFFEIPLAKDDPMRVTHQQTKMIVPKTQRDPTFRNGEEETPITFINEVTHWWDGSQIYGSDQETVNRLRNHEHGKLRLENGMLPLDSKGIEETGFTRNWWVGLSMFHTLFAREHNAICDRLQAAHPDWLDDRLFNTARLINAAVMAKIHTIEWTPAILPNRKVWGGVNANWYGLLTNMFQTGKRRKTLAKVNVRNLEMGGAVGNPINKHRSPYGLTEEFTEVYRLHSLLPDEIKLRRIGTDAIAEEIPLPRTRQSASARLTQRVPLADLFYSFGNQHPGELTLNNFPSFMQEMSVPGNPMFDLGALEILRCRERAVPRYNEFRRQLRLNPISSFGDLTNNASTVSALESVYGTGPEGVEKLDLMIGTLAEEHRPFGFGFGETLFQIFILNATRRLQADRFYTDSYNEETYTSEGLAWIDDADLKTVLLRHYPELAATGLANVRNAFEPWDTGEELDLKRHPLRAFDPELRRDPERGDRGR